MIFELTQFIHEHFFNPPIDESITEMVRNVHDAFMQVKPIAKSFPSFALSQKEEDEEYVSGFDLELPSDDQEALLTRGYAPCISLGSVRHGRVYLCHPSDACVESNSRLRRFSVDPRCKIEVRLQLGLL